MSRPWSLPQVKGEGCGLHTFKMSPNTSCQIITPQSTLVLGLSYLPGEGEHKTPLYIPRPRNAHAPWGAGQRSPCGLELNFSRNHQGAGCHVNVQLVIAAMQTDGRIPNSMHVLQDIYAMSRLEDIRDLLTLAVAEALNP